MPVIALSETWYLFFLCISIALAAWMVFIWAVRSGQFKDPEETAERMLDLDERSEALPDPETGEGRAGTLGDHAAAAETTSATGTASDER